MAVTARSQTATPTPTKTKTPTPYITKTHIPIVTPTPVPTRTPFPSSLAVGRGVAIYAGSTDPAIAATDGSLYLKTSGTSGTIFQRINGAWVALN